MPVAAVGVKILMLILFGAIPLLLIAIPVVLVITLMRKRSRPAVLTGEEEAIVRQISTGLQKMDQRIANLETILLERDLHQKEAKSGAAGHGVG